MVECPICQNLNILETKTENEFLGYCCNCGYESLYEDFYIELYD